MYAWIAVAVAFAASLGFGFLQTWNLRACQSQSAKALAAYAVAIETQNAKVSEWQQKATAAQARAAQAGKQAAEASKIAKQKEAAILGAARPSEGATCEERESAVRSLISRFRAP